MSTPRRHIEVRTPEEVEADRAAADGVSENLALVRILERALRRPGPKKKESK